MVILIGTLLGIGCGCTFGVIISRLIINKRMIELEDEKLRILEKQLSVVAEKCDRTHKACRLLSDIVKENYKTEEKEEREASKMPWSEIDKMNALTMGHQIINRREIEEMVNSTYHVSYPQTYSMLSQQECSVEDLTLRNMELMQNCCSMSAEEAQRRIFYAMFPWLEVNR